MTEIQHLQKVILMIAKDIDKLCRENGIEYYLLGGSCIGAIRHQGFIPWDDDFDIIMSADNYDKFLSLCDKKLDKSKYYFQKGLIDWPLNFSKIKLKGTHLKEYEGFTQTPDKDGIYIDVFRMENVINKGLKGRWQYFLAKILLCHRLSIRTYNSASIKKRIMMFLSFPMNNKYIRRYAESQVLKYNTIPNVSHYGFFDGRTRWHSGVIAKKLFGKPTYVKFEDTELPVPEKYHDYLTQVFGDYMKLPPIEQRKGLHLISVDFGNY